MEEHATSRSISPAPDDARLASLLTATFAEQAERATPAADALVRLNVRLDAGVSARPWWAGHLRLAGAVAAALIVLVLVTPIGRLAAAGIHNAAQAVVTTITHVKDFATGDGGSDNSSPTPNPPGTPAPPVAVNGSAVATSPMGSSTRSSGTTATGSSVTGSATRTGTNAPGSTTGTASGTIVPGMPTPMVGATATATNTPAPPASTTAPTAAPSRVPGATAPAVTSVTATPTIPPAPPTATAPRPPTATSTSVTGSTPVSAAVVPDAYAKGTEQTPPPKGAKDQPANDVGKPGRRSQDD